MTLEHQRLMCSIAAVSGLAAFGPSLAWAQARPETTKAATVGELVVTAQRREERVRDVPLSITAVTGETLERAGVTNSSDLKKVTPGYMIYMYGGAPQPVIRGISSGAASAGDSSNVAVYVDNVYMPTQGGQLFDLPDIERVEILKGPQGTLFGRNAAGGAVRVISRSPSFTPTGNVSASYGSWNDLTVKGFASAPLTDKLAGSLAGFYEQNDGWTHNDLTGKRIGALNSYVFRTKLLYTPTDKLKFLLAAYTLRRKSEASFDGNAPNGSTITRLVNPNALIVTAPFHTALNTPVGNGVRAWGANLNADYDTEVGRFTSTTAYQRGLVWIRADADFTSTPIIFLDQIEPFHTFSQEVDFSSRKFGRTSFTLGAYYEKTREFFSPLSVKSRPDAAPLSARYADAKTLAEAVFGEVYIDVTDHLQLIGGLRYSYERKTTYAGVGTPIPPFFGRKAFTATTPRFSAKYSLSDDANVYFTYSKGFKSGVFDPTGKPTPLLPEKVTAYEVGFKGRVLPTLEVTAAAFDYDYTNLQVQVVQIGATGPGTQNAAKAKIKGMEGSAVWTATPDFTLRTGVSYLDAKYRNFANAVVNVPILLPSGAPCRCGNASAVKDVSGNRLVRTPKWTANLTAEYAHEFAFGEISASATVYYTSKWWSDITNRFGQPSYTTLDGQIGFRPGGARWKLSVWGKNLTDETYFFSMFSTTLADGATYAAPRSAGVRVDYEF